MLYQARQDDKNNKPLTLKPTFNRVGFLLGGQGEGFSIEGGRMNALKEYAVMSLIAGAIVLLAIAVCNADEGQASWYSYQSCVREGTSGVFTATGERFNEMDFTCAMPSRKMFGKMVKVTNLENGKSIVVRCNDYGPAKRLVKKGRIIDLSKGAFAKIASLKRGLIRVRVEVLNG